MFHRLFLLITIVVMLIAVASVSVLADPMASTWDNLRFQLNSATTYLPYTRDANDTVATVTFNFWSESPAPSGNLQSFRITFTYNADSLRYIGANRNLTNWPAERDATFSHSIVGSTGTVVLSFACNNCMAVPTSPTAFASIDFSLKCQPENSTNGLHVDHSSLNTYAIVDGVQYYPTVPLGHQDGAVVSADYHGTFRIHDTTLSGGALGTIVQIPVYAQDVNFKTYAFYHYFNYDNTKLEFLTPTQSPSFPTLNLFHAIVGGQIRITGVDFNRIDQVGTEAPFYLLRFRVLGAWDGAANQTQLTFDYGANKSFFYQAGGCELLDNSMNPLTYENQFGHVAVGEYVDTLHAVVTIPQLLFNEPEQDIPYVVKMKSTFPAGNGPGFTGDTQVVVNFDMWASSLKLPDLQASVVDDSMAFAVRSTQVPGVSRQASIYQYYSAPFANWWPARSTPKNLFAFTAEFDSTLFVPLVDSRWVKLRFLDLYTDGLTYSTHVLDTTRRISARMTGNPPRLVTISDSVEVAVGQLFLSGGYSNSTIIWDSLFIKSPTCSVDSFAITISDGGGFCLNTFAGAPNVTYSRINPQSIRIRSTTGFSAPQGNSLIFVGRMSHGVVQNCPMNKSVTTTAYASSPYIRHQAGSVMFAHINNAGLRGKCNNGTGGCYDADPEPDIPLEKVVDAELPLAFDLYNNYPNPFNPETQIAFDIPHPARVRIEVLNLLGQLITVLTDEEYTTGHHEVTWRGTDQYGQQVASGIYFYRMQSETFTKARKMLLVK